jgi:hypothetical protein
MPIAISCPACQTGLKAPDHLAGKAAKCPKCGTAIAIPVAAALAPQPAAPASRPATARTAKTSTVRTARAAAPARRGSAAPGGRRPSRPPVVLIAVIAAAVLLLGLGGWLVFGGSAAPVPPPAQAGDAAQVAATGAPEAAPAGSPSPATGERPASTPGTGSATIRPASGAAPGPLAARIASDRVALIGGSAATRLRGVWALSDGSVLVCGKTADLAWTGSAPRTELAWSGPGGGGADYGFILHLEPDLNAIRRVYHLPKGAVDEITRIRSTEVPGTPTGELYISGALAGLPGKEDGYWIARLDRNLVAGPATALRWARKISCRPRDAGGGKGRSDYIETQPWDVRADGVVVYVEGVSHDFSWAGMSAFDADGADYAMPAWPQEGERRMLVLKAGRKNSLRSATQADFDLRQEDENGNPGRKGRWPDDVYFNGPLPDGKPPGYTGYRPSDRTSQRVGKIAIDRRNGHLYFGTSTASKLPGGNPDYEPAIIAMDEQGTLKWWARGYREVERSGENANAHGDKVNSPPDQYVDAVDIDYAAGRLVVLARCHGNGVINFWNGDKLARSPGATSFQKSFTGSNGNIHIQWLGRYGLDDGKIYNATYLAEWTDSAKTGKPKTSGRTAGWPSPNDQWPDVNTTRAQDMTVDHKGRPFVVATGRRPITTTDALIPGVPPGKGTSAWAPFVRGYEADYSDLVYSSLLRGPWDTATGKDAGHTVELNAVLPVPGGVLVVGHHASGEGGGSDVPTTGVPAWAGAKAGAGENGFFAALRVAVE